MHFYACTEFITVEPAYASEDIMTPAQANGLSDDVATKSSMEIIVTSHSRVACNGGGGPLGHAQIFLTRGIDGRVTCPYCSRVFVKIAD